MLIIVVCLLQFRKYTDQDITKNFPHNDVAITVGRAGLAFVLLLSFPLLIVPCRQTLNKVYYSVYELRYAYFSQKVLGCLIVIVRIPSDCSNHNIYKTIF